MKKHSFSIGLKAAIAILQGVCIGIAVVCLITLTSRMGGTFDLSELGRSFEESAVFLHDVRDTIRHKVNNERDTALFLSDGEVDPDREIDIRQYAAGVSDSANRNENVTYHLGDLIEFEKETLPLLKAVGSITQPGKKTDSVSQVFHAGKPASSKQAWIDLKNAAEPFETILPVTGKSLAMTAGQSSSPYETLLSYYEALFRTCMDLHDRYIAFSENSAGAKSESDITAPSNIGFFVEDTQAKKIYTNLGVKSMSMARDAIEQNPELSYLFEGVRTMDIMVANSEHTNSETAARFFIDTQFAGPNERVLIAVNRKYPVSDVLNRDYRIFRKRIPLAAGAAVCMVIAIAALCFLFYAGVQTTGRSGAKTLIPLGRADLIPTEIVIALVAAFAVGWMQLSGYLAAHFIPEYANIAWMVLRWIVLYEIVYAGILGLIRRARWKTLCANSIVNLIRRVSSQVLEAKAATVRLLLLYGLFIALNYVFLRYFSTVGTFFVIVLDMALLLFVLRDQLGRITIRKGLRELSEGKLDYKIDTKSLSGDSLEMARTVNEMGDGLQKAVDSLVNSERMKADLITNVSHDLKTPLTSIINYVDLLKRENLQDARAAEYIAVLDRKSQRLKTLITDLIDANKISSGNVTLDMTDLEFQSILRMAIGEFEDRFEEIPLKPEFQLTERVMIRADGSQLWRVLENLLGNIVKYAKPESAVRISLTVQEGMANAVFENESAGKLLQSGEELGERFVRGDASRNSEGSGLGLSIAGNLTRLMGGKFSIHTEETTFRAEVAFPVSNQLQ